MLFLQAPSAAHARSFHWHPSLSIGVRSDCSLPSRDSDALVLRAAVLLDEMVEAERPDGGGPTVAAQVGWVVVACAAPCCAAG